MPSFMENVLRQAVSVRDDGLMFGPVDSDRKLTTNATRDMGPVAARLLADDSWTGQQEMPVLGLITDANSSQRTRPFTLSGPVRN